MFANDAAKSWVRDNAATVAIAAATPLPIPGAHTCISTALEAYMIYKVARIYGRQLTISEALALVPSLGAAILVGKGASVAIGESVGQIPVIGWLTKGVVSGTVAYGMGRAATSHFEKLYPNMEADENHIEEVPLREFIRMAIEQMIK